METVLRVKVDEFLAQKIDYLVKRGAFRSEDEFLKRAVEELVRKWEARSLTAKMDTFAEELAKKHPESVASAVLKARAEEDAILYRGLALFSYGDRGDREADMTRHKELIARCSN